MKNTEDRSRIDSTMNKLLTQIDLVISSDGSPVTARTWAEVYELLARGKSHQSPMPPGLLAVKDPE